MTAWAFLLLGIPWVQEANPKVPQQKVDAAIGKGTQYLLEQIRGGDYHGHYGNGATMGEQKHDELIIYTLIYAGNVDQTPEFQEVLKNVLDDKLIRVYRVALQAMALEALDPLYYQGRIAQCAQFLIDNQCRNGQWAYGEEVQLEPWRPPASRTPMGDSQGTTKGIPKIALRRRTWGPNAGDNSNLQVALLGLRSCLMAGIRFPRDAFELSERWWVGCQNSDGGWDYDGYGVRTEHSYGAMTAGGLSSLALCRFYLDKDIKAFKPIRAGCLWLSKNLEVKDHPQFDWSRPGHKWIAYWLYALERAGVLMGTEVFGDHEWYPEGANYLLESQESGGSWKLSRDRITDTCFAILFLRRATKPLKKIDTGK